MSKSAPLGSYPMVADIIPQDLPSSQLPESNPSTVQKLPSAGSIKVELQEAWAEFIKRFEPFDLYVTLTFKEPKHPESADKGAFMADVTEREKRALHILSVWNIRNGM